MWHAEACDESSYLISANEHVDAKVVCDWRNSFGILEGCYRRAPGAKGSFNDEITFGEKEPGTLVIAFIGACGEASFAEPE